MNNKSRSNKSICEKSMKLMTNIVKVSYFSIAKTSLRIGAPPPPPPPPPPPAPSLHRYTRNLRLQQPINSSKPVSYLIHPDHDTKRSSVNMIKDDETESVDMKAWDFIRKVREKNLKDM
ncbi:unnamed protein product [Lactuca virosa]|uniref:Uncharacterized protein n=1 Tax=Lactuca virosa TaxID=75947 RepID=A0AAU9NPC9_9ASTR|nr:unnamed protein product [Lactuca virosa]